MELQKTIQSQYLATLEMLKKAVTACPESEWDSPVTKNKFWHIAYHALFYTHLYLQPSEGEFQEWEKHKKNSEFMGATPWPPHEKPVIEGVYDKATVLEYLQFCEAEVRRIIPELDFDAPSGFSWLPFGKLELQFYNIRHTQQHVGELCERLGEASGIDVNWVGQGL